MKHSILLIAVLICCCSVSFAQPNYLDNYIGNAVTLTTIGDNTSQLNQPRDLDFKPNTNECWVVNYGTTNGGSTVIFYDAGLPGQNSQYRKDTHSGHFMIYPSAMAFGNDGKWAAVSEIKNTASANSTFMGPALWLGDTNVFAKIFQNNWVSGLPLGSHLDMLHQSPFAMGIAHDSLMVYWVMDGHNGNICKYNFVADHGPGYDNHSAGRIWRYIDVLVTRVPNVPSHMVLDKATGWLYFIDGGPKQIKRMDTFSGTETGNLTVPSTASEPLASYKKVEFSTVEILDTLATQPCGMDFYKDRLVVSDYTTGDIYLYSTSPAFTLLQTIQTGHPGMMGVKVGPDGRIWCVNETENKLYRLDISVPAADISIRSIDSPVTENCLLYQSGFFSTAFNLCSGIIAPAITIANNGSTTFTTADFEYNVDGLSPITYTWTGSLPPGATTQVSLPSSPVSNGSHVLEVAITTADDVDLNNTYSGSFRAFDVPFEQPLNEGFTAATFPPVGWNYVHFNPNNKMARATVGGFGASTGSMKMDNYAGAMDITGQKDYLITPIVDMTSATAAAQLKFSVAHARYSTATVDQLEVLASTDCGNSWTAIYNKSGAALATAPVQTTAYTPSATQWRSDSVSLSAYAGIPELLLAFTSTSNFGNNVYVDDIFIGDLFTGVDELQASSSMSVYPNPTGDAIYLTIGCKGSREISILITDATGKQVYNESRTLDSGENKISLSASALGLSAGVYFVSAVMNEEVMNERLVIQHN
jgi:hypothetical protein